MTTVKSHNREGFSLIEIMIAVAIMAIIAMAVTPAVMNYLATAKKERAKSDIRTIKQAIDMFYVHTGQYPSAIIDLIKRPGDEAIANKWEGPYLKGKQEPKDPWSGKKYFYEETPDQEHLFELYSAGSGDKKKISVWDLEE